jgi:fucose permease
MSSAESIGQNGASPGVDHLTGGLRRTTTTWAAYLLLGLFGYLETLIGPSMPFLRAKLDLNFTVASVHFAAFAIGGIAAGVTGDRVLRRWGRRRGLWGGMLGMSAGATLFALSPVVAGTLLGVLLMGYIGTLSLVTNQTILADLHGNHRTQALTESNVAASSAAILAPLAVGGFARFGPGWEVAVLLGIPALALLYRRFRSAPIPAATRQAQVVDHDRDLPRAFWLLFAVLFMTMSVEWCIAYWGADFLDTEVGLERATAATAMSLFFGAMVAGRLAGAWLSRKFPATLLLLVALVVALCGFPFFWLGGEAWISLAGLFVAGVGVANFYPLTVSAATGVAAPMTERATSCLAISGGTALLTLPLVVGAIADLVGLQQGLGIVLALLLAALLLAEAARRQDGKGGKAGG